MKKLSQIVYNELKNNNINERLKISSKSKINADVEYTEDAIKAVLPLNVKIDGVETTISPDANIQFFTAGPNKDKLLTIYDITCEKPYVINMYFDDFNKLLNRKTVFAYVGTGYNPTKAEIKINESMKNIKINHISEKLKISSRSQVIDYSSKETLLNSIMDVLPLKFYSINDKETYEIKKEDIDNNNVKISIHDMINSNKLIIFIFTEKDYAGIGIHATQLQKLLNGKEKEEVILSNTKNAKHINIKLI